MFNKIAASKNPLLLTNLLIVSAVSSILFAIYLRTRSPFYLDLIETVVVAEGLLIIVYLGSKLWKNWISGASLREEKYKLFTEIMEEAILIREGEVIVEVNDVLARMLGYEISEMIGQKVFKFMDPQSTQRNLEWIAKGYPKDRFELNAKRKDGTTLPLLIHGKNIIYQGRPMRLSCGWDVSEYRKIETALADSQERFKRFAEVAKEGILIHDRGVIVDANQALADMMDYRVEEMIGKDLQDFADERTNEFSTPSVKSGQGLPTHPYEITVRRKDGSVFPMEVHGAWFNFEGKQMRVVRLWDLSARIKMEEALRRSEESFRNLVEKSPEAMFFHADLKILYVNKSLIDLLGYSSGGEFIGRSPLFFSHPDDRDDAETRIHKLKNQGDYNPPSEKRLVRKDGSTVFAEIVSFMIFFEGVLTTVVLARDLTERKKMEKALAESQERIKRFAEVSREGIVIHENGVVVDVNEAGAEMIGYVPREMIGRNNTDFLDVASAQKSVEFLRDGKFANHEEVNMIRKDKTLIPVELNAGPLTVNGRNMRITNFWDLSNRKKMEEALRISEHNFRNLIEKSPEAMIIHSLEKTVYVNQAMLNLLGYSKAEEIIGTAPTFIVHPDDAPKVKKRIHRLKISGDYNPPQERRFVRKDGTVIFVDVVSFLVYFEGVPMTVAVARDLTEQKKSQEALMKFERLSTIGEMAAGMAHEIRNPLAAISTAAQILQRKKIKEDSGPVETILAQCERLERLVKDTLGYAKTGTGQNYGLFSVKTLLETALNLSQLQFGPSHGRVKIHWDLPAEDIQVKADSGRIQQILVNLILNAFQIVGDNVEIKLGLKSDGKFVFVRVEDNGPGITEKDMERVFEPFFTTKDQGSGLGLAISQRIAQEHGGKIVIEQLERGTAFVLQLPLNGEPKK